MFTYWYSSAAERWLVADREGHLIAQFRTVKALKKCMEMKYLYYAKEQCDKE